MDIENLGRPGSAYHVIMSIDYSDDYPPNYISNILSELLAGIDGIKDHPSKPFIRINRYNDSVIVYDMEFWIDFADYLHIPNEVKNKLYYMDMLGVMVNLGNTFVQDVSREDLLAIFTVERWSDVNPEWPEEKILRYIPTPANGEFGFFVERIFNNESDILLDMPNTIMDSDPAVLMDGVIENIYAIGVVGYANSIKRSDELALLSIGQIPADLQAAEDGLYPLTRPLLLYTDSHTLQEKPQVAAFISYVLNHVEEELEPIGYLPVNERVQEEVWTIFLETVRSTERFLPKIDGIQSGAEGPAILADIEN